MQTTSHLLMIRPNHFGYNAETAVNNAFQVPGDQHGVAEAAVREFDDFVAVLRDHRVDVTVVEDSPEPHTPDAVFPNNWISFHEDGSICLYPMFAPSRRLERKEEVLDAIAEKFEIGRRTDLTAHEKSRRFLEGTGSMVLDRDNRIAYACLSPRTDETVLDDFCQRFGYRACIFNGRDAQNGAIYHTNVMMCVADRFVVLCVEAIPGDLQREATVATIAGSGKELIPITLGQMNRFAGNMLQVAEPEGKTWLVMSSAAYECLEPDQRLRLSVYGGILHSPLRTIETNGGGSARCMMAEVFLPVRSR